MKSPVVQRSIMVDGEITRIGLEDAVWRDLEQIAKDSDLTVAELVSMVEDGLSAESNLSSAIRTYIAICRACPD